ncbi:hypothetical protein ACH5RR_010590 [Cinchona calisaya]|uniref:Uncharacterized protein n=1 Tax=Cinchona calisaya TaxID=153742 RepID=A0ABD3AJD6_9GENT
MAKAQAQAQGKGRTLFATLKTAEGCTALHLAASAGKTQMCRYFIQKLNFDVNVTDFQGKTPLYHAILGKHSPTTMYLLENGADVTKSSNKGYTPLHYAAEKGSKEFLKLLISKGAELRANSEAGTPLHCAAAYGNKEALKFLLELNADPSSASPLHFSPLLLSILAESFECMELLLKAGADPNASSMDLTPLCYAASEAEEEMIRHLLKAGADPNIADPSGITPLEHAALNGFSKVVMLLFPVTSCIASYPDWSISGVMKHVRSGEARAQRELKQKELFQLAKEKGGDAYARKDYLDAIYWYSQAVQADPTDEKVLSNRSLCWAQLNEGDPALSDAQACVGLKPDWAKAHYREGVAWKMLKNYDMAVVAFSEALTLDPDNKEIEKAYRYLFYI